MKRLKFMLAAAAAIGLATASHAAATITGSTNFETGSLTDSLFQFDGAAGDNESAIVEEAVTGYSGLRPREFQGTAQTKILQVSTGTDPLLRKINASQAGEDVAQEGAIYIDTLVQFTVTPATDTVETNANDKLLIYLKDNGATTNLMVRTALYTPGDDPLDPTGGSVEARDVSVSSSVVPGQWYRLTVKSYADNGLLLFNIWLDGNQLAPGLALYSEDDWAFPSLLGKTDTTLAAVGFAGEGKVDDLSFTQLDPLATSYDFTLTFGTGVSGVSFTIGQTEYTGAGTYPVYAGDVITIGQVAYDTGYMAGAAMAGGSLSGNGPYEVGAGNCTLSLTAMAEPTVATVSGVTATLNGNVYTFAAPAGSVIGSLLVNGDLVPAAAGQTSYDWTAIAGASVVVAATKQLTAATHPWYENPEAVVLAEDLPYEGSGKPSAFHGQGQDEFLGLTYGTRIIGFGLFTVDGTNTPTVVTNVAYADLTGDLRGVAISKVLGIALVGNYYSLSNTAKTPSEIFAFPLDGGAPTTVTLPNTHAFDSAAFSPDGKYLFSNAVEGESSTSFYVKWAVSTTNGVELTKVGSIAASGRGRNLAYARINGRDLVFGLVDAGKIAVIDMTGDTPGNWTATDMITDLPVHSYGSLCVSGVNATGATPTLTVATSKTSPTDPDVLNVYALTVPASGTVTAAPVKSFDQTALTAAGFGTQPAHGNTVYVTDDNKTIYFARADRKLYAAEYAAPTWATYLGAPVDGAYEIDNLTELKAFQANVGVLPTAGETFKLTADIALDAAWPGIGIQNGKDKYTTAQFEAGAFQGTFDGQNHTISNFQMVNGLDYCGFFNSITNATIQNLKIGYAGNLVTPGTSNEGSGSGETVGTFVGVANSSTLRNLTSLAGSVTCWKGFGGIVGFVTAGTLVESCTNNVNLTSIKPNKAGGIAIITQGLTGSATFRNCQNNGTTTGSSETGGLVGYIGQNTVFENCESTVAYKLFHHQTGTVTVSGVKGNSTVLSCSNASGVTTPGLNFATVDGNVATFVADDALALNGEYKVMASGATATFEFTEAGTIAFDTALATPTYAVTLASGITGLTLSDETVGTVTTYTAAAFGSPIHPGEQTETTYTTQADAEAALATVENSIAASSAVATALGQAATEAYLTNFTAKVVEVSGGYKVEVGLTVGAEAFLQAEANDDAAAMIEDVTAATITIKTMPGFYYSIKSGSTLSGMTEGNRTLATGGTLTIDRPQLPLGATSGFYKVLINIGPKQD